MEGIDANVQTILDANSRTPVNLRGDLAAQWSAVSLGARELAALAERNGDVFMPVCNALIAQAEQMTRAALRDAPDGDWAWHDQLDGDGISDDPVHIAVRIRKTGDAIDIDFAGSSPQVRGPVNASPGSVLSAALFFMRTLAPDAPNNAGCLAPLTLAPAARQRAEPRPARRGECAHGHREDGLQRDARRLVAGECGRVRWRRMPASRP